MCAPYASVCASLPVDTRPSGTRTKAGIPACAAYAASEADVLPVDAHATASAPIRLACVRAAVMPRSLNDALGLCPSCFSHRSRTPAKLATASRATSGVFPSGWLTISSSRAPGSTSSRKRQTPERCAAVPR